MPKKNTVKRACPPGKHTVKRKGTKFCRKNAPRGEKTAATTARGSHIYQVKKKTGKIVQYTISKSGNKRYLKRRRSEIF